MTTKVKAQKFRVRRSPRAAATQAARDASVAAAQNTPPAAPNSASDKTASSTSSPAPTPREAAPRSENKSSIPAHDRLFENDAHSDGFGDAPFPGSAKATPPPAASSQPETTRSRAKGSMSKILGQASDKAIAPPETESLLGDLTPADETQIDAEIDAIRREGLTGRQLRMARRVAQKHAIAATSDFDAIRLLRQQGIDPFQRNAVLDLVSTDAPDAAASRELTTTSKKHQLPKTVDPSTLPSKEIMERITRENEISQIQLDIAKRRRRKLLLLAARLAVFVGIPTLLAGVYFYTLASPMYATHSSFVIQQSEAPSAGGLGSLLSGSPLSGSQDSITVQDYLMSRDAMLRLDADVGFKDHFSSEAIDPIQRLSEDPSNESSYKVYTDRVTIGYDPTEGLLKMEVVAADPAISQRYSEALIQYAEEQVDRMTDRIREDSEKGARSSLEDAESKMMAAQERIVGLQESLGIISPEAETSALMGQITTFETQLQEKRLAMQQLEDNLRPNKARVDGVKGDIRRLETLIGELRSRLTVAQGTDGSLARITAELRMAEVELQTRQALVSQSVQALEAARIEATRQVKYLSVSSRPIAPDEPSYPRKFENTLLAFFIFSGIYLMASLTAAVLREQVSS